MRKTKIVASLGPATDDPNVLRGLIRAGMNVARVNLSHGTLEEGMERYHTVRAVAEEEGVYIGILADMPGPKVRAAATSRNQPKIPKSNQQYSSFQLSREIFDVNSFEV